MHATYDKQQGQAPNPINCVTTVNQHTFTDILQKKHNSPIQLAHVMYMTGTTFQATELFTQWSISYKLSRLLQMKHHLLLPSQPALDITLTKSKTRYLRLRIYCVFCFLRSKNTHRVWEDFKKLLHWYFHRVFNLKGQAGQMLDPEAWRHYGPLKRPELLVIFQAIWMLSNTVVGNSNVTELQSWPCSVPLLTTTRCWTLTKGCC